MRVNGFLTFLALLIGAVLFYAFNAISDDSSIAMLSALPPTLALIVAMGIYLRGDARFSIMFKTTASVFFVLLLGLNILFLILDLGIDAHIIWNSLILLVSTTVLYLISRAH